MHQKFATFRSNGVLRLCSIIFLRLVLDKLFPSLHCHFDGIKKRLELVVSSLTDLYCRSRFFLLKMMWETENACIELNSKEGGEAGKGKAEPC